MPSSVQSVEELKQYLDDETRASSKNPKIVYLKEKYGAKLAAQLQGIKSFNGDAIKTTSEQYQKQVNYVVQDLTANFDKELKNIRRFEFTPIEELKKPNFDDDPSARALGDAENSINYLNDEIDIRDAKITQGLSDAATLRGRTDAAKQLAAVTAATELQNAEAAAKAKAVILKTAADLLETQFNQDIVSKDNEITKQTAHANEMKEQAEQLVKESKIDYNKLSDVIKDLDAQITAEEKDRRGLILEIGVHANLISGNAALIINKQAEFIKKTDGEDYAIKLINDGLTNVTEELKKTIKIDQSILDDASASTAAKATALTQIGIDTLDIETKTAAAKNEKDTYVSEKNDLKNELSNLKLNERTLALEKQKKDEKKTALDKNIKNLNDRKIRAHEKIDRIAKYKVQPINAQIITLKATISAKTQELDDLRADLLNETEKHLVEKTTYTTKSKAKIEIKNEEIKNKAAELDEKKKELNVAKVKHGIAIKIIENKLKESETEIADLKKKINENEKKIEILKKKIEILKTEIETLKTEIDILKNNKMINANQIKLLTQKVSDKDTELATRSQALSENAKYKKNIQMFIKGEAALKGALQEELKKYKDFIATPLKVPKPANWHNKGNAHWNKYWIKEKTAERYNNMRAADAAPHIEWPRKVKTVGGFYGSPYLGGDSTDLDDDDDVELSPYMTGGYIDESPYMNYGGAALLVGGAAVAAGIGAIAGIIILILLILFVVVSVNETPNCATHSVKNNLSYVSN
jgi:hypothetical protein